MNGYIIYFTFGRVKHKQPYELSPGMSIPKVFGVYGKSEIGKTTLIEQLVARLAKDGYQVATVKQTNKAISMDTTNKDTWRHHRAGAHLVVFSSRSETNFLLERPLSTSEILRRITAFGTFDIILIEGADDPSIPKIQIGLGKKRNNTIALYKENLEEILQLMKRNLQKQPDAPSISITVNGGNIPLSQFPAQIISSTIVGMLSALKEVHDISDVTIALRR
jgi:molybdopterin-guanine dinucleotide biosynthesis protein MobB